MDRKIIFAMQRLFILAVAEIGFNANVVAALPDNKVSNVQQFNVQFQYQLTISTAVSAGYVGTRGRNLILYYNLNGTAYSLGTSFPCPIAGRSRGNCYPGIGAVTVRDDNGKSQYYSLQIQAERRLTRGWQYIAACTFSKTAAGRSMRSSVHRAAVRSTFAPAATGSSSIEPVTHTRVTTTRTSTQPLLAHHRRARWATFSAIR